ncbi:MAG: helix-turn-helix transcriptional regulator [Cytophagales bacterium]|nr:helix-turn-helix transcriptional regulator [Armatimonadota bacterium]
MSESSAPTGWDFVRIGRRVRSRRLQLGLSAQDLADRAGIARQTIVRIESGKPCKTETLNRIRHVLNLFYDFLTREDPPQDFCVQHYPEKAHWTISRPKTEYQRHGEIPDPRHEDDPQERLRLGRLGYQPFFTCLLNSELPGGILNQGLMEIYRETWVDSHPGEEFVYCLSGKARIWVRGTEFLLEEGSAITFKGSEPHQYAPAETISPSGVPLRLLIVVALGKGDPTRNAETEEERAKQRPTPRTQRAGAPD